MWDFWQKFDGKKEGRANSRWSWGKDEETELGVVNATTDELDWSLVGRNRINGFAAVESCS